MPSLIRFAHVLIRVLLIGVGLGLILSHLPNAIVEGVYRPLHVDAFYHARRILDTVADPSAFFQFDPFMHRPEGGPVIWPWGFDWSMAMLIRGLLALGVPLPPEGVMALIAPGWFVINAGLFWLVIRALRLLPSIATLALACFTLLPLVLLRHLPGDIDHHFMEFSFSLLTLGAGLHWLRRPDSRGWAIALGMGFGLAVAMHTALFILQLPLLAALGWMWLRGQRQAAPAALAFGIANTLITTLVLIPVTDFPLGLDFDFTTLSWFHPYVAGCTSLFVWAFSRYPYTPQRLARLAGLALALAVPLIPPLKLSAEFLSNQLYKLQDIDEAAPLLKYIGKAGFSRFLALFSSLILITPFALVGAGWLSRRTHSRLLPLLILYSLFGLALLWLQVRASYYAVPGLLLPLFYLADRALRRRPQAQRGRHTLALAGLCAAALAPTLPTTFFGQLDTAGGLLHKTLLPMFPILAQACEERPGTVLADFGEGHFIRYYTRCGVIANPFILTPLQIEKIRLADDLLYLKPEELRRQAPWVDYVLLRIGPVIDPVNPLDNARTPMQRRMLFHQGQFPSGFRELSAVSIQTKYGSVPFAALYRIEHDPSTP